MTHYSHSPKKEKNLGNNDTQINIKKWKTIIEELTKNIKLKKIKNIHIKRRE